LGRPAIIRLTPLAKRDSGAVKYLPIADTVILPGVTEVEDLVMRGHFSQ
jgi:hypothetical protein